MVYFSTVLQFYYSVTEKSCLVAVVDDNGLVTSPAGEAAAAAEEEEGELVPDHYRLAPPGLENVAAAPSAPPLTLRVSAPPPQDVCCGETHLLLRRCRRCRCHRRRRRPLGGPPWPEAGHRAVDGPAVSMGTAVSGEGIWLTGNAVYC